MGLGCQSLSEKLPGYEVIAILIGGYLQFWLLPLKCLSISDWVFLELAGFVQFLFHCNIPLLNDMGLCLKLNFSIF